jgi:hypothetical protein
MIVPAMVQNQLAPSQGGSPEARKVSYARWCLRKKVPLGVVAVADTGMLGDVGGASRRCQLFASSSIEVTVVRW